MAPGGNAAIGTQDDCFDLDFTKYVPPAAPVVEPAARAAAASAAPLPGGNIVCFARAGTAGKTASAEAPVLVVEDHEASRRMLVKMLALLGHPVRAAADNREMARELRQAHMPKLILLDIGLPRVDGYSILNHLRSHPQTSEIPVVLVTGRTDRKDVIRGLSLGAEGYLSKPVSVKALQSVMDTVLWKQ